MKQIAGFVRNWTHSCILSTFQDKLAKKQIFVYPTQELCVSFKVWLFQALQAQAYFSENGQAQVKFMQFFLVLGQTLHSISDL
jgi:hypothetical protein